MSWQQKKKIQADINTLLVKDMYTSVTVLNTVKSLKFRYYSAFFNVTVIRLQQPARPNNNNKHTLKTTGKGNIIQR